MKSAYKNATKEDIRLKINELKKEQFPFSRPILQRDTFWIYCRTRLYWGTYRKALYDSNIEPEEDGIKSEYGYEIDWWEFKYGHDRRELLAVTLDCLYKKDVDITPKGLKNSPYFDIYTDAVNLFGKYDSALEYTNIPNKRSDRICYPESKDIVQPIIEMYCCDDPSKRSEMIKK